MSICARMPVCHSFNVFACLSVCLSVYPYTYLYAYLPTYLQIYLCTFLPTCTCLRTCLPGSLPGCLPTCVRACVRTYVYIHHLSIYLSMDIICKLLCRKLNLAQIGRINSIKELAMCQHSSSDLEIHVFYRKTVVDESSTQMIKQFRKFKPGLHLGSLQKVCFSTRIFA